MTSGSNGANGWLAPEPRAGSLSPALFRLLIADEGFVLIAGEDACWHRLSDGCLFCQCVGRLIEMPRDVVELEAVELVLQLSDLMTIRSHLGVEAA